MYTVKVKGHTRFFMKSYFIMKALGEMAERLKAAVLKTVEGQSPSQGSNPCLSANKILHNLRVGGGKGDHGTIG